MTLFKTSCALLLLVMAAAGLTAFLVIDEAPLVTESSTLTPTELRRARQFIREVFAANRNANQPATLELSESDTEILLTQVLENLRGGDAAVDFQPGRFHLQLTAAVPPTVLGGYANVDLTLQQQGNLLVLDHFRLGSLELPGWLADKLLQFGHRQLHLHLPEYTMLVSSIAGFRLLEDSLELNYTLTPETLGQLSAKGSELLFPPETSERLQAHAGFLAELETRLEGSRDGRNNISLAAVLNPMFRFAQSRGGDAAQENRAALLVLALHQMDMNPARLLQGAAAAPAPARRLRFTLYERRDYAQHFLGSAVLAVSVEPGLADAIALLKEMDDAQEGGSGFSFTDLAADMAGIRFAALAVTDPETAPQVQTLLADNDAEDFFLFDIRGLPEFLDEQQFRDSYGDTSSAAYQSVLNTIEAGLDATPLFQLHGVSTGLKPAGTP